MKMSMYDQITWSEGKTASLPYSFISSLTIVGLVILKTPEVYIITQTLYMNDIYCI